MTADKLHDDEVRALDRPGAGRDSLVPTSYAEKAMSSLLRLHEDLVEEKERRIDLYRRLMEREQSLAEMRAYVKLLEGELARRGFDPTQYAIDPMATPPAQAAGGSAVASVAEKTPAAPAPAAADAAPAAPVARAAAEKGAATGAPAAKANAAKANAAKAPAGEVPVPPQPQVSSASTNAVPPPAAPPSPAGEPLGAPVVAWTPGPGARR